MYLTDLARAARKSGLKVVEVAGWKTRGHGGLNAVRAIVPHHTAGGNLAGDLKVVTHGRAGLAGPLSQIVLAPDGTVYIVAAGKAWHAGPTANPGVQSNSNSIGIEAVHRGVGAWTDVQYSAYVRLVAALVEHYNLPTSRVFAHKEVAVPRGRKVDPNFDMGKFRADVEQARRIPASFGPMGATVRPKVAARVGARTRGPYPLPRGHWYGPESRDPRNHSGYAVRDRGAINQIQAVVRVPVDGRYGPQTKAAVVRWQKAHGLTADGLVGAETWSKMGAGSAY